MIPSYAAAIAVPLLAAIIGVAGAALGLWLTGLRQRVQMMVPFSAGVLLGVALFGRFSAHVSCDVTLTMQFYLPPYLNLT